MNRWAMADWVGRGRPLVSGSCLPRKGRRPVEPEMAGWGGKRPSRIGDTVGLALPMSALVERGCQEARGGAHLI